jgi:hypothetical protein
MGSDSWETSLTVDSPDLYNAVVDAQCIVRINAWDAGLPQWPFLRLMVLPWSALDHAVAAFASNL